jgi:vancomycin permeability regulator SanA
VISRSRKTSWLGGHFGLLLARSFALFLGAFIAVSLLDWLRKPSFDPNIWWIDLGFLPRLLAQALLVVSAALLLAFALRPAVRGWRHYATTATCALLAAIAVANGVVFYVVWAQGRIRPAVPLPLSFLIALVLVGLALASRHAAKTPVRGTRLRALAIVCCAALWAFAFPLAQQFFFGTTSYSRPAQAAVVFGAEVHADGRPSAALAGRVLTAVALYRQGLVHTLVLSGARGGGGVHQVVAMRRLAEQRGVPASSLLLDFDGVNTAATVRDTVPLLRSHGLRQVIAVSDFYHLPRIKLAYASAGLDVLTVPAVGGEWIAQTPYLIVRDDAGFWVYLLRETV